MELYAKVFEDMSHLNCMVYKREMRHGRVSLVRVDATYLPDIFWDAVNSKVEGYGRDRDGVVTFHHKRLSNAPERFLLSGPFLREREKIVTAVHVDLSDIDVNERPGNPPRPDPAAFPV